jgi:hypothetical protein
VSIRDHLVAIHDRNGYLTPALVVDTARPEDHPLHARFEWDDAVGGEAWRRHQAHQLIRSVRIEYLKDERPRDVRAFVAVPRPDSLQPSYEPTETAMVDPIQRRIVLQQMEREWRTFKARYEDLVEFADMIKGDLAA